MEEKIVETRELHEWVYPVKVIASSQVVDVDQLLTARDSQVPLFTEKYTEIEAGGYVVLDFGQEYTGGIRILTYRTSSPTHSVKGRVRFGESVSECMAEIGEKNANNHHSVRDMVVDIINLSDLRVGSSAFRFVRLDNLGDYSIKLIAIYLDYVHSDAKILGGFHCDDEKINAIFEAAQRTLFLNLQNGMIWDGVKRDRLVWAGDLNVEILTAFYSHGNIENIRNSLELCAKSAPLPMWMNRIPTYSMWFIVNLYDYYSFTADETFVRGQIEYVDAVVEQLAKCVNNEGYIDFTEESTGIPTGNPYFVDWPSKGHEGVENGVKALFHIALKKLKKLYAYLGLSNATADRLLQKLEKREYGQSKDKQIVALMSLAKGVADKEKADFLKDGGARGMSTFMAYYILSALSDLGETEAALQMMKEYFGGMLSVGATTFFEDFDMEWLQNCGRIDELPQEDRKDIHGDYGKFCYIGFRHSLCHGWASGAAPFLMEKVLGFEIVEPGFKKIRFNPLLCGLKRIDATIPTPMGLIEVHISKENNKIVSEIFTPEGVSLT